MKKKILFFLSLSFFPWGHNSSNILPEEGRNRIILVSDVDDTIKVSGVAKLPLLLKYGPRNRPFFGLSQLYNSFVKEDQTNRKVIYLSATIPMFKAFGQRFLKVHNFPHGDFIYRGSVFEDKYKFKTEKIEKIIENNPKTRFILIGDNGELDSLVYRDIKKKYPRRILKTFLHKVYDFQIEKFKIHPGQTPYLLGLDLAAQFYNINLIRKDSLKKIGDSFRQRMKSHMFDKDLRDLLIPHWVKCQQFFRHSLWPFLNKKGIKLAQLGDWFQTLSLRVKNFPSCR